MLAHKAYKLGKNSKTKKLRYNKIGSVLKNIGLYDEVYVSMNANLSEGDIFSCTST